GGDGAALMEARNEIRKGEYTGPDIYFSAFLAGDWYYNRDSNIRKEPYFPWEQRLLPGDNLDEAMLKVKSCGATGVKLYHSFDAAFLKDIVKAAKKHDLLVWGHTMIYPAKPIEVVQSGVQVLSHVSMLEGLRGPDDGMFYKRNRSASYRDSVMANVDITEFVNAMKENKAILDATICVSVKSDPWILPLLKRLHQQGVEISAGTDQIVDLKRPYPYLIDELSYFVSNCGFSNAEAIRSATIIAAKVVGQQSNIGLIKKGRRADLIVMKENPLKEISALKDLDMVIKSGRIITVN
ncbi:MAG: amidohydrolase family protein, partial [Pedobacter sp.]|uniref:amidohydrolase family protein n=1 Tax=Pedobacter sp. TaxID=1411316 RepID=UPI0033951880